MVHPVANGKNLSVSVHAHPPRVCECVCVCVCVYARTHVCVSDTIFNHKTFLQIFLVEHIGNKTCKRNKPFQIN